VIFATGSPEVVIAKVFSIPCGKTTLVALVKVGAVSAANRGGAAKAVKMPNSRMAHVRTVQVRILLDETWQEWFSIDKEITVRDIAGPVPSRATIIFIFTRSGHWTALTRGSV
jgi:hypothetical protein